MLSVAEARSVIRSAVPTPAKEDVSLDEAGGRVLAEPLSAAFDLPRFTSSAEDGFAVRSADVGAASRDEPSTLCVARSADARAAEIAPLGAGQCAQVMVGAALPAGADAVIAVEHTGAPADDRVEVYAGVRAGQNIRHQGEEVVRGEPVMPAGTRLHGAELSVLAGFGLATVPVFRRPTVSICVTGDALRQPGRPLGPGQIYDATTSMLSHLAGIDANVVVGHPAGDRSQTMRDILAEALECSDVVVLSGGVSMPGFALLEDTVDQLGLRRLVGRIAQQPAGRMLVAGPADGRKLVFGMPSDTVASLIGFVEYVIPALQQWQGRPVPARVSAILRSVLPRDESKHCFRLGKASLAAHGFEVTPASEHGSGVCIAGVGANCVCEAEPGQRPLAVGDTVRARMLPWAYGTPYTRTDT